MALRRDPIRGQDLRYLRRRANRRVREVRRAKTVLRLAGMIASNLAVFGVLVFGGYRAVRHLAASPVFDLEVISVGGVERASADALRGRLEPFVGRNLLDLELQEVARRAADDPWIRRVSVKRTLPQALRLTIEERRPVALAVINGLAHVVDEEGFVVGASGPGMAENLPVLTGLEGLSRTELRGALARGVRGLARLSRVSSDWTERLSEIDVGRGDRIIARTTGIGPAFLLDPARVERNLEHYLTLRAEIEERIGPAEYVDLRWRDRISVMPGAGFSPVEQ